MRELVAKEKGDQDRADIKLLRGGLIDVEFIAQFMVLAFAATHPQLLIVSTAETLRRAGEAQLLAPDDAQRLLDAHRFYTDVIQMQRIALPADMKPAVAPAPVRLRIAAGAGLPDEARLDRQIVDTADAVAAIFARVLGR